MQFLDSERRQVQGGTRVEPSRSLVDRAAGFKYVNAASTDLSKRFKAMRAAAKRAAEDAAAEQAMAAQQPLMLECAKPMLRAVA